MKLFIANLTKQHQGFTYRVLESEGVRTQHIPVGQQIQISGDLSQPDIDYIIRQHERYGLVRADEIDRKKPFVGLCYSVDKPVREAVIHRGVEHNTDILVDRGREIRQETAIATNNRIEHDLGENQDVNASLRKLDVSVVEEEPTGGYRGEDKPFSEGVTVTRDKKKDA